MLANPSETQRSVIVTKVVVEQFALDRDQQPKEIIDRLEQQLGPTFNLKRIAVAAPSEGGFFGSQVLKEYDADGRDLSKRSADISDRDGKLKIRLKYEGTEVATLEFNGGGAAKTVIGPQIASLWQDGSIEF